MTATTSPLRAAPAPLSQATERGFATALVVGYLLCFALLPVELDSAFGLPAHPLLLHLPVILIPLLVLATIAVVFRPAWRERYGFAWAGLGIVALASTVLAAGAGDKFIEDRPFISQTLHEHKEAGETLRLVMFVFVAVVVLAVLRDWRARWGDGPAIGGAAAGAALMVIVVLLAGVSGFFVVRAGHLGSKSVWNEGKEAGERGSPPPGGGDRD